MTSVRVRPKVDVDDDARKLPAVTPGCIWLWRYVIEIGVVSYNTNECKSRRKSIPSTRLHMRAIQWDYMSKWCQLLSFTDWEWELTRCYEHELLWFQPHAYIFSPVAAKAVVRIIPITLGSSPAAQRHKIAACIRTARLKRLSCKSFILW